MKRKLYFFMGIIAIMSFWGCQKMDNLEESVSKPKSLSSNARFIPYESVSKLKELQSNEQLVDYEFSRKAALLDMNSFRNEFGELTDKPEFSLSEIPVVVYDTDGLPKFYEFIVMDGNSEPVATITSFAKKEVMDFTACVLPFIRNYTSSKALLYSAEYPYTTESSLPTRSLSKNVTDRFSDIDSTNDIEAFWNNADSQKADIISTEDIAFLKAHETPELRKTTYYTIPRFDKDNLKRTRFTGWCGPAAMAWVYRGFYSSYKGKYIPLHGESSQGGYNLNYQSAYNVSYYTEACEIYKDFERESKTLSGLITGATMPDDFDKTVKSLFPEYRIDRHKGEMKGAPRRAIQRGNPVYLVVFAGSGSLHYIIGFGTKDKYGWFGIHSDSWIYVTDNVQISAITAISLTTETQTSSI